MPISGKNTMSKILHERLLAASSKSNKQWYVYITNLPHFIHPFSFSKGRWIKVNKNQFSGYGQNDWKMDSSNNMVHTNMFSYFGLIFSASLLACFLGASVGVFYYFGVIFSEWLLAVFFGVFYYFGVIFSYFTKLG